MRGIRHLLAQRTFAVMICAAALLLKLLVPAGYMIDGDHGRIAITLCPGTAPGAMAPMAPMAMPVSHGDMADHGKSGEHGKADAPCAFAGLSAATTGAIDPVQLLALLAFVMAAGVVGVVPPAPIGSTWLRPPLRGPPAYP